MNLSLQVVNAVDLALSRAKSHLHETLLSGNMSCTHNHESCRRRGGMIEQAAAPFLPGGFHMGS